MENKNKYETIIILKGNFKETGYEKAVEKIKDYLANYEVEKIEEIGKRKLAYTIRKNTTGYYLIIYLKVTKEDIEDIKKFYRLNDDIIKFIVVKTDNDMRFSK